MRPAVAARADAALAKAKSEKALQSENGAYPFYWDGKVFRSGVSWKAREGSDEHKQNRTNRAGGGEVAGSAARQKAEHEASGMDSCCNKNLLIAAAEQMLALSSLDTEASTDPESASEPRRHLSSMSWVSIGLGCLLWLISARRRMSGK